MCFYWTVNSLPELRDLPAPLRHQIAYKAMGALRVSFFSGLVVVVYALGAAVAGSILGILFGKLIALIAIVPMCLFVKPLLLNLARPQIREILSAHEEKRDKGIREKWEEKGTS